MLLVHGWALTSAIWQPLARRLEARNPDYRFQRMDFGYFGPQERVAGHFEIAVGHSLGLLWLLEQTHITFDKIVSLAGFTRFYRDRQFKCGVPSRLLTKMQADLQADMPSLIQKFLQECGGPLGSWQVDLENSNFDRLNRGLYALKSWDRREQWNDLAVPATRRLVIAARSDPVVSAELTSACFSECSIHWLESDSHLLPLAEPDKCASLIQKLIEI